MNWLFKNFWLKIVAFCLGLLVWLHVETEKIYNHVVSLPISEITLSDGLVLAEPPPDSLEVSVLATGKQLLRRRWRSEGVRINASQFRAGRFNINLSTQNTALVHPTTEVTLQEISSPKVTRLEIDAESSVKLPVAARIEVSADDGFAVGQQLHLEPASASLIGPRSRLKDIDSLRTAPRRLGTLRNPVTITLPLEQPIGYGFRVEPDSVSITIPVFPVKTRVFERLPIQIFNAPPNTETRTRPDFVRVELTGPPDEIDRVDPNALTLSVDYHQIGPGNRTRVHFDCPPGFRLKSLSIDSVAVVSIPYDNAGD
ncbi:MAG: hypothetical protein AB1772_01780 [Candidatus Zixiibacteriota bacterium]